MARVRGISGIFFKSPNPEALREWYAKHLGIVSQGERGAMFPWNQPDSPYADNVTAWCVFPASTTYSQPSQSPFMMNYVVDDLHAVLDALRKEGVWVDPKVEEHDYGKFGWIMDPGGNRIELGATAKEGSKTMRNFDSSLSGFRSERTSLRLSCVRLFPSSRMRQGF